MDTLKFITAQVSGLISKTVWNVSYNIIRNYWLFAPKIFGGQEGVEQSTLCSQLLGVQIKYIDSEVGMIMCSEKIDSIVGSYTVFMLTIGSLYVVFQVISIIKLLFTFYVGRSFILSRFKDIQKTKILTKKHTQMNIRTQTNALCTVLVKHFRKLDSILSETNLMSPEDKVKELSKHCLKAKETSIKYSIRLQDASSHMQQSSSNVAASTSSSNSISHRNALLK
jgi:hypothetical protein